MVTAASGTGPPFSSVIRPERVAPETWARVGAAEQSAKARASDRQIHFANEEVQPLLNISFPPGALPGVSARVRCGERLRAKALRIGRPADLVLRECARNHKGVQSTMRPIENTSTSLAW